MYVIRTQNKLCYFIVFRYYKRNSTATFIESKCTYNYTYNINNQKLDSAINSQQSTTTMIVVLPTVKMIKDLR